MKRRARDLGLPFTGETGPTNTLTDVPGVAVGMTTLIAGDGPLDPGRGPVRTGVTAILPRFGDTAPRPVWAGVHAFNGNGEMTGTHWIRDAGYFLGPICLTNTHAVGIAHQACVRWMIETYAEAFAERHAWALPVVAETYDGLLNDINGLHVREAHARQALDSVSTGPVAEGNVGGGTGMVTYEFKGGTGTASRRVRVAGEAFTLGVLVQANHGIRDWLTVLGVPVGQHFREDRIHSIETGSIIVVIGTDAPMLPHQLARLARRAGIGIGRGGTVGGNSSGDIFLAFSTANGMDTPQAGEALWSLRALNDEMFDRFYEAAVEATEEAVVNAMLAAEDMTSLRPPGRIVRAIDHEALCALMRTYNRLHL
jgi:D-aminopeptidase